MFFIQNPILDRNYYSRSSILQMSPLPPPSFAPRSPPLQVPPPPDAVRRSRGGREVASGCASCLPAAARASACLAFAGPPLGVCPASDMLQFLLPLVLQTSLLPKESKMPFRYSQLPFSSLTLIDRIQKLRSFVSLSNQKASSAAQLRRKMY
jgi:hypothetical protein